MGDIIILVMVASPCQVSENVQLKSFIVTVTVPHSPLAHSTRTDSGCVADTNVQTARRYPSPMRLCTKATWSCMMCSITLLKRDVAIVCAFFRVCDVNILTA